MPIPAELLAPMNAEIEQQLRQLVEQFGIEKVRDALILLIAKCKFSDWQCVANAVSRIATKQRQSHK